MSILFILFLTSCQGTGGDTVDKYRIDVCGYSVSQLTLATTQEVIRKGYMFKESLEIDEGMLFVFKKRGKQSFWMKNVSIPLLLIFINDQLEVVDVHRMKPGFGVPDHKQTYYPSSQPVRLALEVNPDILSRNSFPIGCKVVLNPTLKRKLRYPFNGR